MQHTPLGVTVATLVLLLFAALANQQHETEGAYASAKQQYESTKRDAPLGNLAKSSKTDPKSYREEWRNEQDLEAQRDMATWAYWMLVATCFNTAITAIGVAFVAWTLDATREANRHNAVSAKAAQDQVRLMQAELRAWLAVDSVEADYHAIRSKNDIVIPISVKLSNTGKSTALNTRVAFTPFLEIGAQESLRQRIDEAIARRAWTFEPSTKNIAAGKPESIGGTIRAERLPDDEDRWSYQLYVLIVVTYETVGQDGPAETGRTFHTLNLRIDHREIKTKEVPRFWPTDSLKQWMT